MFSIYYNVRATTAELTMSVLHFLRFCSRPYGTQVSCYVRIGPASSVMAISDEMPPVGSVAPDGVHSDSWAPVSVLSCASVHDMCYQTVRHCAYRYT